MKKTGGKFLKIELTVVNTLESLPPSIMKRFWAIYELPADSKGLKFEARALAAFGEKKKVALGI